MNKDLIKKLAEASYANNQLAEDKINKIITHLSRNELKAYIKALKEIEKKFTIYVDSPFDLNENAKKDMEALFSNKKIIFRKNPDLIAGIKITKNDIVYNLSLKDSLGQIRDYLEQYL